MIVAGIVAGLSGVGLIQALAGLVLVNRFDSLATRTAGAAEPPVTVLKPLHGGEPLLEEALSSVCRQVYPSWQVVFGVSDPADSALPVVRRLQARFPACDIAVVVDPTPHGPNRKVANLINMLPAAKHDVLVIADSDVHVAADWLKSAGRGTGGAGHRPGDDGVHRLALRGRGSSGRPADQPLLPPRRAAGARHGAAGLPRRHAWCCDGRRWSASAACTLW